MERTPDRVVNLRSLPDEIQNECGNVWLVVGPGWRNHLKWKLTQAFKSGWSPYWIGMGDLGDHVPPSGILHGKKDIQNLITRWDKDTEEQMNRILFVEDPQGSGVWEELVRSKIWIEFLSRSKELSCEIIIGTGSPLNMARMVLENTDYLFLRCSGEDNIRFLTSGSRLSSWLDAIGRDLFDDIRIYRKILTLIGQKNRDLVVNLTSEAETIPERIFWWDRSTREVEDDRGDHYPSQQVSSQNIRQYTPNSTEQNIHLRAKVNAAIALLKEVLSDLS
jgi:hypothetical protein